MPKDAVIHCCIDLHVESVLLLELLGGLVQLVDGGLQLHLEGVHLLAVVADATVSLASFWSCRFELS